MSIANRHKIDSVTVWTLTQTSDPTNPFGGAESWAREVIACEYESGGGTQKDQNGAEFQPQTTIWPAKPIPRGSRVKIGSHMEVDPPADTETVRKTGSGTGLSFQPIEYEAWTG